MPQPKKHASTRARRNKASTAATLVEREPVDRSTWTVAQLRAEIRQRNEDRLADDRLPTSGTKARLREILDADDNDAPPLPDRPAGWHAVTRVWWDAVWASPMSDEWHFETDVHNVYMAAMHYDDMWNALEPSDRQKATIAYDRVVAKLGLTPYDRRRLEWTIATAKGATAAERRRSAGSQPPSPAPAGADPRAGYAGLTAVS